MVYGLNIIFTIVGIQQPLNSYRIAILTFLRLLIWKLFSLISLSIFRLCFVWHILDWHLFFFFCLGVWLYLHLWIAVGIRAQLFGFVVDQQIARVVRSFFFSFWLRIRSYAWWPAITVIELWGLLFWRLFCYFRELKKLLGIIEAFNVACPSRT